jgi:hypothetical protein
LAKRRATAAPIASPAPTIATTLRGPVMLTDWLRRGRRWLTATMGRRAGDHRPRRHFCFCTQPSSACCRQAASVRACETDYRQSCQRVWLRSVATEHARGLRTDSGSQDDSRLYVSLWASVRQPGGGTLLGRASESGFQPSPGGAQNIIGQIRIIHGARKDDGSHQ